MNGRRWGLLVGVLLLLAANVWRWVADPATSVAALSTPSRLHAEDLRLIAAHRNDMAARPADRNLFEVRAATPAVRPSTPVRVVAVAPSAEVPEPGPPPKSAEQLAEETGHAEFAQIRLVGVVFRANRGEAYLVKGDQIHLARRGDRVGERFTVESIDTESVVLKDSRSALRGTLKVAGK